MVAKPERGSNFKLLSGMWDARQPCRDPCAEGWDGSGGAG